MTLVFKSLDKGDSSEGGVEEGDVGVLRPEENWDINETTIGHWSALVGERERLV